jgi:uncharacterized protein (TIGR02231 family)
MSGIMDILVEAKVNVVTVYPEQARVSLRAEIPLVEGVQTLIFDELPIALLQDSVRFAGKGAAQVRIHGVDLNRVHYERTPTEKVMDLEGKIQELEDDLSVLADEEAVLEAQAKYLKGLLEATNQYARGLARGQTNIEDQVQLSLSIRTQDMEIRSAARALTLRERDLRDGLDKLRRELNELQSGRLKERYQARVEIEVLSEGTFSADLTYVVRAARWQPLYDVRLLEVEKNTLQVTGIAQVTQSTGQDWTGVRLILSTARTALSQRAPELKPWYLNKYVPPQPRMQSAPKQGRARVAATQPLVMESAEMVQDEHFDLDAGLVVATTDQAQSVVSYTVERTVDIPSDGAPHKTTISQFSLHPEIDYLTVPRHTDAVYRRVKATNDSPGPMLGGQVSLFVGDEYIGKTKLKYVPKGDEIELLLGVEERLTVERELSRREVDKVRLRDKRQLLFGYELLLKNLLEREVEDEVQDQFPVARHEEIKVKLVAASPDPDEHSDLNMLTWNIKIAPGNEQKIRFEFQVEHPRSVTVSGLID